jgi:glycerol kinase
LTRGTTKKELARAALESVGFQTRDLLLAMYADAAGATAISSPEIIRVDGGMTASDWTMQFLADILDASVDRPTITETTALGVGLLAGWQAGIYPAPDEFAATWTLERRFAPAMREPERQARSAGWRDAVARTLMPTAND